MIVGGQFNDAGLEADTGIDTIVVNDSSDTTVGEGRLTAFVEKRLTAANPVEVGIVSGLGMTLVDRDNLGVLVPGPGRVEFEGFETIDVLLGTGNDLFSVGGDMLEALPPTRRDAVVEFLHTTAMLKYVSTGGGSDTWVASLFARRLS